MGCTLLFILRIPNGQEDDAFNFGRCIDLLQVAPKVLSELLGASIY